MDVLSRPREIDFSADAKRRNRRDVHRVHRAMCWIGAVEWASWFFCILQKFRWNFAVNMRYEIGNGFWFRVCLFAFVDGLVRMKEIKIYDL